MARRLEDPALIAATLGVDLVVHPAAEFPLESLRFREEIERVCAADPALGEDMAGFRPWYSSCVLVIQALYRLGRSREVDAVLAESRRRLGESTNALEQTVFHYILTTVQARRGNVSAMLEHGRQSLEWTTKSQNVAMRVLGHTAWGLALLMTERLDEALEQLETARGIAVDRAISKGIAASGCLPLLSEVQRRRGDIAAARAAAESGIAIAIKMEYRHAHGINLIALAAALLADGDPGGAETALDDASRIAAAIDARDLAPRIEEERAQLARCRGDDAGWERCLRAAARLHRDNGEEWQATRAEARL